MSLTSVDRDYLTMLYEENAEHARHHETLRATAASLFIALIAGILAFAAGDNREKIIVSGLIVCIVSLIGLIINHKHTERYELHLSRLRGYRKAAEIGISEKILNVGSGSDMAHNNKYWFTSRYVKLRMMWSVIYIAIFIIGTIMIVWQKALTLI